MADTSWLDPVPKKPDTSWMKSAVPKKNGGMEAIGGVVQHDNQANFDFLVKYNQDNQRLRAQNQSWVAQTGLMIGNSLSNLVTGTVEGFGYLPELFDADRDYSNALTRTMQEWKNPFGEIYRENPNQVFDWSDPAWWMENIQGLVESAGAFAVQGSAYAKIFGSLAKGAAGLARAGKVGTKVANASAQLASGTLLAYTEGAMSGYRVYEETYRNSMEKNLLSGMPEEEARAHAMESAGNAAATTVKVNTAMNTLLNVGALSPLFRNPSDEILNFMRGPGAKQAGESLADWRKRLSGLTADNPQLKKALATRGGWSSFAAETVKEGIEEVNTQFAEAEGARVGKGENRSILDAITDLNQYFTDVTNQEGALNFALGAFGGAAQTVLIDNIPVNRVVRYDSAGNPMYKPDKDGKIQYDGKGKPKYQTELISSRTHNSRGVRKYYENLRDAVIDDIKNFEKKQQDLAAAVARKDEAAAETLRNQLFSIGALDAVSKGLTESWQQTFEEILNISNNDSIGAEFQPQMDALQLQAAEAENEGDQAKADQLWEERRKLHAQQMAVQDVTSAMQKGLAVNRQDNAYKERAKSAIEDLKHLQEVHNTIQRQYVDASSPVTGELADHLFFRKADLYLRGRAIQREEERLNKIEALDSMTNLPGDTAFTREVAKYNAHIGMVNDTIDQLQKDADALEKADKAGDMATINELIEKYRAKGINDKDLAGSIQDLHSKLVGKAKLYKTSNDAAYNQLANSLGFQEWLAANPGKTFQDMIEAVGTNQLLRRDRANLEMVKAQHAIAEANMQELSSKKGLEQLMKALAEDRKAMLRKMNERNKKENTEAFLKQQSKKAAAALDAKSKEVMAARLDSQIADLIAEWSKVQDEYVATEEQLHEQWKKKMGVFSQLRTIKQLQKKANELRSRMAALKTQIASLQEQRGRLNVKIQETQAKAAAVAAQPLQETLTEDPNKDVDTGEMEAAITYEQLKQGTPEYDPANDSQQSTLDLAELAAKPEDYGDPLQEYMNLANSLPPEALPILDMLDKLFDREGTSIQRTVIAFQPLVNRGVMTQFEVNDAFVKLAAYHRHKQQPVKPAETVIVDPAVDTQGIPGNTLFDAMVSLQPEIRMNPIVFEEKGLEDAVWDQRPAKPVSAVKVNSADLVYKTTRIGNVLRLRNETVNGAPIVDPNANLDRMIPGRINVGDDVYLEIDPNPDPAWQINNDYNIQQDENLQDIKLDDSFNNYIDENGKIRMGKGEETVGYGNVPIRIVHSRTGKTLGYFPRTDWVTATGGSGNFRNLTDLFPADANGERASGNVLYQQQLNLRIRKRMAALYNQDPKAKLKTRIVERTNGTVMYHGTANDTTGKVKYEMKEARTLLPDPSLEFGVAVSGKKFMIGEGLTADTRMKLTEGPNENTIGMPHVFIPLPNGMFYPSPLKTKALADRQGDVHTVIRAIEIYLQHGSNYQTEQNDKIVASILKHTGFDITTDNGLADFIQQYYTHLSNFDSASTAADAKAIDGEAKQQKFKFAISPQNEKKAFIRVGVTFSGTPIVTAILKDGKLDPKFVDALQTGLSTRFKAVPFTKGNIRGLNDPRPINTVRINKDGKVVSESFPNFNAYLKSITSTSVHGLMQVEGQYVYAANSQIMLSEESLLHQEENIRELVTSTPEDMGKIVAAADEAEDLDGASMDAFESFNPMTEQVRMVLQSEGIPVNLETLEDLYNFTKERNDKTPTEVYEKLKELGISTLVEGYNPFAKCG